MIRTPAPAPALSSWLRRLVLATAAASLLATGVASAGADPAQPPAGTTALSSMQYFGDMGVDSTTGHLLITDPVAGDVVVRDADGSADTTIPVPGATSLAIDSTGRVAYVGERATTSIAQIDLDTLAVTQTFTLPAPACDPASMSMSGSKVWVAYNIYSCTSSYPGLTIGVVRLDPANSTWTAPQTIFDSGNSVPMIAANPVDPTRLYYAGGNGFPARIFGLDVTDPNAMTSTMEVIPGVPVGCGYLLSGGIVVSPDGATVSIACGNGIVQLDASDLSLQRTIGPDNVPLYLAQDAAGDMVSASDPQGAPATSQNLVAYLSGAGAAIGRYAVMTSADHGDGVALSSDGQTAYLVSHTGTSPRAYTLTLVDAPLTPQPVISPTPSATSLAPGQPVTVTGTLTFTDGAAADGKTLTATLVNSADQSVVALGDVTTTAGGAFTDTVNMPASPGTYTVRFAYAADGTHTAGSQSTAPITTAQIAPTLTLTSSKKTITIGTSATLTVHLSAHTAPTTVTLTKTQYNGTVSTATATVGTGGNATFVVSPTFNTTYRASSQATTVYKAATSPKVAVTVTTQTTGTLTGFSKSSGSYRLYHYSAQCAKSPHLKCPVYHVAVKPLEAGRYVNVILQVQSGGAWHQAFDDRVRLGSTSKFTFTPFYSTTSIEGVNTRIHAVYGNQPGNNGSSAPWSYFRITS